MANDVVSWQEKKVLGEVEIMRLLHHDNIAQFIGFSESKGYYYIVLELCSGGGSLAPSHTSKVLLPKS